MNRVGTGGRHEDRARNPLKGLITDIKVGGVNCEIDVEIAPGVEMTSIITKTSCESLGLEVGNEACVIVKASNVMIAVD